MAMLNNQMVRPKFQGISPEFIWPEIWYSTTYLHKLDPGIPIELLTHIDFTFREMDESDLSSSGWWFGT